MSDFSLDDFIDDFLQEANEHLQNINQNLLILEKKLYPGDQVADNASSTVPILNDLFRSFHTLKGLSGMVGLRPAEELSHLMESVLRDIQKSNLEIDQEVIDRLFEGTKTLKAIVASLSDNGEQFSDITDISNALALLLENHQTASPTSINSEETKAPSSPAHETQKPGELVQRSGEDILSVVDSALNSHPEIKPSVQKEDLEKIQAAHQAGNLLYMVVFSPSAEKAERGKNVSQLRKQLENGGSILKSIPLIHKDTVRFAFFTAHQKPLAVEVFQEAEVVPLKGEESESVQTDEKPKMDVDRPARPKPSDAPPHPNTSNVRVDLDKLDEILRLLGEMVVVRFRITDQISKLISGNKDDGRENFIENLEQSLGQLDKNLRDLRAAVMRARMVPLAEVFNHMPLVVRDLIRNQKKEVRLIVEGEHTQIDKVMIERLLDPLLHLVRNAITHGIENPSERAASEKHPTGTLVLRGAWEGDQILIELADDGRGIDIDKIKEKSVELGLINSDQTVDESNLLEILAKHGFTTLDEVDFGAGRGIGMEVVVQSVRSIGGTIELHSTLGKGTIVRLLMPLTLTILDAIIVRVGSERYAIPRHSVEEVIEIDPADIVKIESGELISFRQSPLTLIRLSDLFQLQANGREVRQFGLICCSSERQAALIVDQLLEMREVVVRAVQDPLVSLPGIFGATDLGDGRAVLILDAPTLLFNPSR